MAEEIKRVSSPKASDLKGDEFTWSVALSLVPSKEWSRLFAEPKETTVMCHPKRLGVMHQALIFKCEEAHLQVWVQYIDKWIAEANRGMKEQEEAEKRQKAEHLRAEEEKQRRIREVNDKYRNL